MDEPACFYCTAPNKTISAKHFSGCKNLKKRMTIAVACNAGGTSKLPLLFVGAANCADFGGKSPAELGVKYVSFAKGWVSNQLFQCWAKRVNDMMRTEYRHVLLLLDSVSSYRLEEPLSNVTLRMLSPNTASYL